MLVWFLIPRRLFFSNELLIEIFHWRNLVAAEICWRHFISLPFLYQMNLFELTLFGSLMLSKIFSRNLKNHLLGSNRSSSSLKYSIFKIISYLPTVTVTVGVWEWMSKASKILDPGPSSQSRSSFWVRNQSSELIPKITQLNARGEGG